MEITNHTVATIFYIIIYSNVIMYSYTFMMVLYFLKFSPFPMIITSYCS